MASDKIYSDDTECVQVLDEGVEEREKAVLGQMMNRVHGTREVPSLREELTILEENTDKLHGQIDSLIMRLDVVLSPDAEADSPTQKAEKPNPHSAVINAIQHQRYRVRIASSRIQSILERLEV